LKCPILADMVLWVGVMWWFTCSKQMWTVRSQEMRCLWEVLRMAMGATSTCRDVVSTGFLMHLLGFDHFTSGKAVNGLVHIAAQRTHSMLASSVTAATFGHKGASWASSTIRYTRSPRRGCTRQRGGASARRMRMRWSAGDNFAWPNMPA